MNTGDAIASKQVAVQERHGYFHHFDHFRDHPVHFGHPFGAFGGHGFAGHAGFWVRRSWRHRPRLMPKADEIWSCEPEKVSFVAAVTANQLSATEWRRDYVVEEVTLVAGAAGAQRGGAGGGTPALG